MSSSDEFSLKVGIEHSLVRARARAGGTRPGSSSARSVSHDSFEGDSKGAAAVIQLGEPTDRDFRSQQSPSAPAATRRLSANTSNAVSSRRSMELAGSAGPTRSRPTSVTCVSASSP